MPDRSVIMAADNGLDGNGHHSGVATAASANTPSTQLSWNPQLLLDPRAAMARRPIKTIDSSHSTPANGLNGSSSTSELTFEFSTPNNGTPSNTSTPPSLYSFDNNDTPSGNELAAHGFGHMIERMNNIQDRSSAPPQTKRRKLEAEDSDAVNRGSFGSGANGMMGQYLKDKREEAAMSSKAASRTSEIIEIADEDSDVVEVKDEKNQEVCFGLIQGAKVNCHAVPSPKPGQRALADTFWPQVKIMLNRRRGDPNHIIHAKDYTRQVIGSVDPHTATGLAPLLDSRLQLRTDCRIPTRQKEPGEKVGQEISKAYQLDIMLYGPRKNGLTVAKFLSQRQLWLRNPTRVEPGIKYENPQTIEGPKPPPVVKDRHTSTSASGPIVARTVEEIRNEVMGVFDSLTKSEDLPQMEPDWRIQTELLKHQKQGLYFLTRREQPLDWATAGQIADSFWRVRLRNNGQRIYHNVITGHDQRDRPPDTLGGILADMMGLGKTLSILSLITTSLDSADDWSKLPPIQPSLPTPRRLDHNSRGFQVPTPEPLGLTHVKRNGRATLLICPVSTVTNWEEQIKMHVKSGALSFYIYHGPNRVKDAQRLAQYDIVITTYSTVANEVNARHKGKPGVYPLEEIAWFRVVLDEAHMIREQSTLQFKAICRLQAQRRWAVTGTPVQNRLDDLAALLAFIRLKPFDDRSQFTHYVVAPFKVCDPGIVPKLRILVDSVTLRRLKDKIDLPPRTDHIVRLQFSPSEEKLYKLFEKNASEKVKVLSSGRDTIVGGKVYIHILQSILRLRLICAHGRDLLNDADMEMVQGMTEESAIDLDSDDEEDKPAMTEAKAYDAFELMQDTNNDICHLCRRKIGSDEGDDTDREDVIIGHMTKCYHLFCPDCKPRWDEEVGNSGSGPCPYCNQPIPFALFALRRDKAEVEHETHPHANTKAKSINTNKYSGPHTKTRALVDDLLQNKAESLAHPDEPPFKSVVFSGWTSHLDLIQIALDKAGISYTRLDGKMSRLARTNAMDKFREDDSVHVILVSIMAGGLGLNLTAANNVYVMEPQYNPAAEAQAVDRIHRLGQNRPVRTVRYIMQRSFEEKMLELQEKKMKLASLSMDRTKVMDKAEAARQKLMDLRSLFK